MTARATALSDPGGVRSVVARWTFTTELVLETATHLGGGAGSAVDTVLIRDSRSGGPVLPGSSIAGALRSHLADVLGGYRSKEDANVAQLFGASRGDDVGQQSPLIVFESLGKLSPNTTAEIRDGVQILSSRGTAEEGKKYDLELLPAGTVFPLRFDLIISSLNDEPELVSLLTAALNGLSAGDIAIGARRSRGLGGIRTGRWRATRHELSSRDGWLAWLAENSDSTMTRTHESDDVGEACMAMLGKGSLPSVPDRRRRIVIDADLTSTGPLLVRSAPTSPDAPDAVHLQSAGHSVLPGTSVAGVLRHQAMRIARLVREQQGDAERWITQLFGPRHEGLAREETVEMEGARLRISESVMQGGTRSRPTRVRIDRFTQGVVSGALFDEEPESGGRAHLRLELRNPVPGEPGLCLLALKDLLTGEIAVGGTAAVGHGRFTGTARLRSEGRHLELDPTAKPDPFIDDAIEEFWSVPTLAGAK